MATTTAPSELGTISTTLLRRIQLREAGAWNRFTEIYAPLVYGWARKAGLQREDASNVVQEVFLAVAMRIGRFRREHSGQSFRSWIWTICHYKVRDHFADLNSVPAAHGGTTACLRFSQLADTPPDENSEEGRTEIRGVILRAVSCIRYEVNETTWQAFWRTAVDGESAEDVARELGFSRWAVYKAKSRLLQRLRSELQGLVDVDRLLAH